MTRHATVFAILLALAASVGGAAGPSSRDDLPDVSLTADASPETVVTGSTVTFTLSITNDGPGIATDVTVVDVLPRETTFVSCAASGTGTCGGSGRSRRIRFESIMPDVTETVTLVATVMCHVRDGEELANTASVHASGPRGVAAAAEAEDVEDNETVFVTASNPPPVVVEPTLTPRLPWPADQEMVDVTVGYQILDNCGPVRVALNVSRSEPLIERDGAGPADWAIVNAHHVRVRTERSAPASRRIYTIAITAVDSANQASEPSLLTVTVPPPSE